MTNPNQDMEDGAAFETSPIPLSDHMGENLYHAIFCRFPTVNAAVIQRMQSKIGEAKQKLEELGIRYKQKDNNQNNNMSDEEYIRQRDKILDGVQPILQDYNNALLQFIQISSHPPVHRNDLEHLKLWKHAEDSCSDPPPQPFESFYEEGGFYTESKMLSVRPRQDFDRFSGFVARLLSHIPRYGHVVQLRNEHRHHPQPRWRKVDVNDNMPRKLSTMLNLFSVSIICVATSVILSRVDGFWQRTLSVMGLNLILCGWASFSTAKAELLMLVLTNSAMQFALYNPSNRFGPPQSRCGNC